MVPLVSFAHQRSGVYSLPVELLGRIFLLGATLSEIHSDSPFLLKPNQDYVPPPSSFQILVSHVCQHWRQVALRIHSLWTTIHIREPIHLIRAQAYLARCSTSIAYLLDILVDTVAQVDHIPGVTLCRDEINTVFDLIIPHVDHWRSFHLKIRDNDCKLQARRYLGSCGPAPRLETLQLYHFEDYRTSQNLYLATYRPPVVVFNNSLPCLKNVSLIGVNLPWVQSPYLMNLHKLELALHLDNIRPSYDCWERMLRLSPKLRHLCLHYSGPRLDEGSPSTWPSVKEKIPLEALVDLSVTDLDPDYLCDLVERLYLPSVRKMSWDLPDQDFSNFVDLISGRGQKPETIVEHDNGRSKLSISSLLCAHPSDFTFPDNASGYNSFPMFCKLDVLIITALECSIPSWRFLLESLEYLGRLEVDFLRVGARFWDVLVSCDAGTGPGPSVRSHSTASALQSRKLVLLPRLRTFKLSGVSGISIKREIRRRASLSDPENGVIRHWIVKWSPVTKGRDAELDDLVVNGCPIDLAKESGDFFRALVKVDTFEDEEEGEEDICDEEDETLLNCRINASLPQGVYESNNEEGNIASDHSDSGGLD